MPNVDWSPAMARAAEQAVAAFNARARGKWGTPKPLMGILAKASEENTVHIFNVGPWNDWARLGSWGDWFIPAKPDNARFTYCCAVPGAYAEYGMNDGGGITTENIEGEYVAQCIVGEGPQLRGHNDDNRAQNGVFISSLRGPKGRHTPTIEDLEAAEARLLKRFHELVDEANEARALGGPQAFISINEKHHLAAKRINRMDLDWARDKNPTVSFRCPGCDRPLPETATICQCNRILKPAEFWAEVQQGLRLYSGEVPVMFRTRVPEPAAVAAPIDPPKGNGKSPKDF